jgi:hypothetical protein
VETRLPADQHHNAFLFRWNEPKKENIFRPTDVAFQWRIPKRAIRMQRDFLVLVMNEMGYDVASAGAVLSVAEPAEADAALGNAERVVVSAVLARVLREILGKILWFAIVFVVLIRAICTSRRGGAAVGE